MGKPVVRNLDWKVSIELNRAQVLSLGKLAEFVGNIEKDISTGFSDAKSIDWSQVRTAFSVFSQARQVDKDFLGSLKEVIEDFSNE